MSTPSKSRSKTRRCVGVYIDEAVYQALRRMAEAEGRSVSNYLRFVVLKGVCTPATRKAR